MLDSATGGRRHIWREGLVMPARDELLPNAPQRHSPHCDRIELLSTQSRHLVTRIQRYVILAKQGLAQSYRNGGFVQTMRLARTRLSADVHAEGESLRYTSIAALGLSRVNEDDQKRVLFGDTASGLGKTVVRRALDAIDPAEIALAAWAGAEICKAIDARHFRRLRSLITSDQPISTVACAWALLAATAVDDLESALQIRSAAAERLMAGQTDTGLFPHVLPARAGGRMRSHVGCFADQVYPIQALARLSAGTRIDSALASANRCAAAICELQGAAGQWWWHYDVRDGSIVEGYPVYSVHQHAMAPMALFELQDAGGTNYVKAIAKGLSWLDEHPEPAGNLVCEDRGIIWRKIGRREPRKLVRAVRTFTTALYTGWTMPRMSAVFPANQIDYECRPYELGWLLYAWCSRQRPY